MRLNCPASGPDITTYGELPVKVRSPVPLFNISKSLLLAVPISTTPKSVSSVILGVVSPSVIELPDPIISISGVNVLLENPVMSKLYGFSLLSLFAIVKVALCVPAEVGLYVILNVDVPPLGGIGVVGAVVNVNSPAPVPVIVT